MKKPAKNSIRACSPVACTLLCALCLSCYSYSQVRLDRKVRINQPLAPVPGSDESKTVQSAGKFTFYGKKSFCRVISTSPASKIINRGVDLALQGQFPAAAVLFEKVLEERTVGAAACNNLGIIYEIFNDRERAFELYSRACLEEPGNGVFRDNFLGLVETGRRD